MVQGIQQWKQFEFDNHMYNSHKRKARIMLSRIGVWKTLLEGKWREWESTGRVNKQMIQLNADMSSAPRCMSSAPPLNESSELHVERTA